MILYNVTVNIDNSVREDWLEWMQLIHIPEVMATGFFVSNQIARLINEEDNGGTKRNLIEFGNLKQIFIRRNLLINLGTSWPIRRVQQITLPIMNIICCSSNGRCVHKNIF